MFCQLWALGYSAKSKVNEAEGIEYGGAGSIARTGEPEPRPLTVPEIKEYVQLFATAAKNATEWHIVMKELTTAGNKIGELLLRDLAPKLEGAHIGESAWS